MDVTRRVVRKMRRRITIALDAIFRRIAMLPFSQTLTPEKGLIFRITHRDNVPWILQNGLHCQSSGIADPNHVSIGNPELIALRPNREVDIAPGGTLADYIPFTSPPTARCS